MLLGLLEISLSCFSKSLFLDMFNQILGKILLVLKLEFSDAKRQKLRYGKVPCVRLLFRLV